MKIILYKINESLASNAGYTVPTMWLWSVMISYKWVRNVLLNLLTYFFGVPLFSRMVRNLIIAQSNHHFFIDIYLSLFINKWTCFCIISSWPSFLMLSVSVYFCDLFSPQIRSTCSFKEKQMYVMTQCGLGFGR